MTDEKQHKALMKRLRDTNDRLDDQNKLLKKQNRLLERLLGNRNTTALESGPAPNMVTTPEFEEEIESKKADLDGEKVFAELTPEQQNEIRRQGMMEARRQLAGKFP